MNIALIGFMGSGKTTIGRLLASRLGWRFIDTDEEIEKSAGMPVHAIFKHKGEESFRKLESEEICSLETVSKAVISCGGGAALLDDNLRSLRKHALIVLLWSGLPAILSRLAASGDRPLLQAPDKEKRIEELFRAREGRYRDAADVIVRTDGCTPEMASERIVQLLKS